MTFNKKSNSNIISKAIKHNAHLHVAGRKKKPSVTAQVSDESTGLTPWDNFISRDDGIKCSHEYKHPEVKDYSAKYSKPNDYHVMDGEVKHILDRLKIEYRHEPASVYDPQQLFDTLALFGERKSVYEIKDSEEVQRSIKRAFVLFGNKGNKLPVTRAEESLKSYIKLEKSGGIWFKNKEESWDEAWKYHLDVVNEVPVGNSKSGQKKWFKPFLAFYRTQLSNKTRLVWGSSTDVIITEGMFAHSLMENFSMNRTISIGFKRYQLGALVSSIVSRKHYSYSLDFSKFDATVPAFVIRAAFNILRTHFGEFDEFEQSAWDKIITNFLTGCIVMPDGHLYTGKKRGIPSGSWFTQLVGSICNYIVITAATDVAGHIVYSENIMVLGDDSVFALSVKLDLATMSKLCGKFGMTLNVTKSMIATRDERVKYLGFWWHRGRGYRDLVELLGSAVNPEKFRSKDMLLTPEERGTEMILSFLSLSHDGINQAKKTNLVNLFDFDRQHFRKKRMNIRKSSVSSRQKFNVDYVFSEHEFRVPYTYGMAILY